MWRCVGISIVVLSLSLVVLWLRDMRREARWNAHLDRRR